MTSKFTEACRRKTAWVGAMRSLIAVERYRMKYKNWPAKLADVVPDFLQKVPYDPFDGTLLKMAKVADGLIFYSVGPNGKDDGGSLPRNGSPYLEGDTGYQLWDVAKRRRPASPIAPEEKDP